MKEQNKSPEKELSEIEMDNLSNAKFKTVMIKGSSLMEKDAQRTH